MIAEIDAYLARARASKVPLTVILASLRLGLPINAACFTANPGLQAKLRMLIERCSSSAERQSLTIEPWMTNALLGAFCSSTDTCTAFAAGDTTTVKPAAAAVFHSEDESSFPFKPYREARCWSRQKEYYARAGIRAWSAENAPVPSQVSSNLFVAEQYLALVVAQAANLRTNACAAATGAAGITVNIVEVASGHGVLSILIARLLHHRSFRERVNACSATSTTPTAAAPAVPAALTVDMHARVICTDFHDSVFQELRKLPWVQSLCDADLLDFAVLDADALPGQRQFGPLPLLSGRCSGQISGDLLVIIAQYAFDSFASDMYATVGVANSAGKLGAAGVASSAHVVAWEIGVQGVAMPGGPEHKKKGIDASTRHLAKRARAAPKRARQRERMVARPLRAGHDDPHSMDARSFLCDQLQPPAVGDGYVTCVPTAGKVLLQRVKGAFPVKNLSENAVAGNVLMITGDFVIEPDDARWGGRGATAALLAPSKEISAVATADSNSKRHIMPISLDPPEISPKPEITALPLSLAGLDLVFSQVFPSAQRGSSVRTAGPLGGSCFTVVVQSNGAVPEGNSLLSFGPAEYQTLREFIRESEGTGFFSAISISFLKSFTVLGGSNWHRHKHIYKNTELLGDDESEGGELQVILDLRWIILRKCKQGKDSGDALLFFVSLAQDALISERHCWLSLKDACSAKCQLAQWMLAVSAELRLQGHTNWQAPLQSLLSIFKTGATLSVFGSQEEAVLAAMALLRMQPTGETSAYKEAEQWIRTSANARDTTRNRCRAEQYRFAGTGRVKQTATILAKMMKCIEK